MDAVVGISYPWLPVADSILSGNCFSPAETHHLLFLHPVAPAVFPQCNRGRHRAAWGKKAICLSLPHLESSSTWVKKYILYLAKTECIKTKMNAMVSVNMLSSISWGLSFSIVKVLKGSSTGTQHIMKRVFLGLILLLILFQQKRRDPKLLPICADR